MYLISKVLQSVSSEKTQRTKKYVVITKFDFFYD